MWVFLLLVGVPILEIALFIQVGGWLGLWPTLAIVVLTAIAGTALVKSQGARAIEQLKSSFDDLRDPTEPLAHGAMILFSGALLLTPGFFTDALGFALLVPGIRGALFRAVRARIKTQSFQMGGQMHGSPPQPDPGDDVIEGEFTEVPSDKKPTHSPSGWTKH